MARRSSRRPRGRGHADPRGRGATAPSAAGRPASRPSTKAIAVGGIAVALVAIALGSAWSYLRRLYPETHLVEARAHLKAGRVREAERALRAAIEATYYDMKLEKVAAPEPWRLLLEILRVEERSLEATDLAWQGVGRVRGDDAPAILRELTLTLLTDLPDDLARTALARWSTADPADVEARVALLRRIAASPRSSDPDRPTRLAELTGLLADHPENINARDVLVSELADAGEPDRGRAALDGWPGAEADRDARYWRLRGRWDLEYDRRPARAAGAFRKVLADQPHDWRTRYRLARALRQGGQVAEADAEAEAVRRTREVLDPLTLGPKLDSALGRLDDPAARRELAEICHRAGLAHLAAAWRSL